MKFVFLVFFPVSENAENGLGDEGLMGAMPLQNVWARTATGLSVKIKTKTFFSIPRPRLFMQCQTVKSYKINNR